MNTPSNAPGHRQCLLAELPASLDAEQFELLHQAGDLRLLRILSCGQTAPETGWFDQAEDEWVCLLQGAARLEFAEAAPVTLGPGDALLIPAHCRHKVAWTPDDQITVWLALHLPTRP
ncbi:cupin domain-containing protein [Pseudaeromonas paramecii]|uniref:Cupin domain-containing protein n=1 Tax=Pseudaeromonas paramecii TaxID=2138166 RepID=A0ABP8QMZ0_9GAMM